MAENSLRSRRKGRNMLVGEGKKKIPKNVRFISYDGKWPNLCSGILTLEICGEVHTFGPGYKNNSEFDEFWSTGGECSMENITHSEWNIHVDALPEQFRPYAAEIDREFNKNVEFGCCGGCR